ncbi:MAG: hypothetical protein ACUVQP_10420 [Bacteroidales bacterium]
MKKLAYLLLFLPFFSLGQNCSDFLTVQRTGIRYPWKYDIQSKSAVFFAGKSSQLNIICNEGKDYKISFLVSSQIMNEVSIKVTDNTGKVYFSTGIDEELLKTIEQKKQFMLSLENQKLKIKGGKKKAEIDANINNLKLEISKYQDEIEMKRYHPSTFFEFTAASTMELVVYVTATDKCSGKGCVGVLVANKPTEKSDF